MPVRPTMMVLYSNDATEVRYSDGSRLHVLPCGSSFTHHCMQDAHPVHGMKSVQQRCQYATSQFKDSLLAALDFRNRFAERPFLCQELLEQDHIVDLYANIREIAWPKEVTEECTEVCQDGSVAITSKDEFASLVLSPHRQDFTICYLSHLSDDKKKVGKGIGARKKVDELNTGKINELEGHTHVKNCVVKAEKTEIEGRYIDINPKHRSLTPDIVKQNIQIGEGLNLSPITQASCADSPQSLSAGSGSPFTLHNASTDDNAKFRPFSTPTEGLEQRASGDYYEGSFLCEQFGTKPLKAGIKTSHENKIENRSTESAALPQKHDPISVPCWVEDQRKHRGMSLQDNVCFEWALMTGLKETGAETGLNQKTVDCSSKTRHRYTWLTRHVSCDECPAYFRNTVKMAKDLAEKGVQKVLSDKNGSLLNKQFDPTSLRKINRKECCMSLVPDPLPLSCPGQHLHKVFGKNVYDDGKNPAEDPSTLSQGRLKVILIDGVIYRIVRLQTTKIVEVYPGDGSVLVSQGMTGQFFQHIIAHGNKLEERTYSLKAPPVTSAGSKYCVRSLIQRANRFLAHVRQEDNMPASLGLCCWKHEEVVLSEPSSTHILEECDIRGYGRFSALSNGEVRIVFNDRTCLDMVADFSARLGEGSRSGQVTRTLADKTAGTCRLLLQNGQYQMVSVQQPGQFKRYVSVAQEWIDWVNSSPQKRETFYKERSDNSVQMSVERELQRIQCFNYIVDNTVLKTGQSSTNVSKETKQCAFRPFSGNSKPGPSILRNSEQNRDRIVDSQPRSVQIHSPSSSANTTSSTLPPSSQSFSAQDRCAPNGRPIPIGQASVPSETRSSGLDFNISNFSGYEGFNSVRKALIMTSSVIKDIDQLLERK
ncbi:uncharacterized protein C5orf34 homolog [Dreissena polymorpha]|nr:uncharacterized protein C5orf34 homolog [Dreissena polymorpha]XP_052271991.1 uncharacterized protein C5orf34 homolog [Dreissena polymorpha]